MTISILRTFACLTLVSATPLSLAEPLISDKQAHAFMKQYENALETEDFTNVAPLLHPAAIFRFNDGDHTGADVIQDVFEKTWAAGGEEDRFYLSDTQVIHRDVNSATVMFKWHWSGVSKEHGAFHVVGRGTSGIVRVDGKLKLMFEHLSQ